MDNQATYLVAARVMMTMMMNFRSPIGAIDVKYVQQESKVSILVPRVTIGNPQNQPGVLSTISKAHWMPLKLATFGLKTLDKEGRCKSRFEIDQFSIVANL
jgi:hypothetical protein